MQETGWCCDGADAACCTVDGIGVRIDVLPAGAEVGTHTGRIYNFHDTAFQFTGTVTITNFSQPYENPPGRIAGSISGTNGTKTVSGSFDNTFCAALLSQTI
jgi:hypothetical protein